MKTEFRKAINCIIDKDNKTAKAIIKNAIQTDARYIAYKKLLQEYGFDFKTAIIDNKIYEQIENILKEYDKPVKLAVLDEMYKKIATNK